MVGGSDQGGRPQGWLGGHKAVSRADRARTVYVGGRRQGQMCISARSRTIASRIRPGAIGAATITAKPAAGAAAPWARASALSSDSIQLGFRLGGACSDFYEGCV